MIAHASRVATNRRASAANRGLLILFRNGVDTPFWDEWDGTAPLFEKMAACTLGFADFFAQHNEHRILVRD